MVVPGLATTRTLGEARTSVGDANRAEAAAASDGLITDAAGEGPLPALVAMLLVEFCQISFLVV